jgi:putative membrane-bound dehydrogenase-like protein
LVHTNFTGFATHNYQARVNGFTWGLDGWLHGSSSLFGGKIKSLLTGKTVDLSGRDFRIHPDTGEIEPVAGISQMGGCATTLTIGLATTTARCFGITAARPLRAPEPARDLSRPARERRGQSNDAQFHGTRSTQHGPQPPLPHQPTLERFNDPQMANRTTSACGLEIYRDDLLGSNYYGNAFICESVHNLVTRLVLEPDGVTFRARRADDEQRSEFLASTDNWFRPVQARTGPDGALWIVDMYRFVIEHPRWIPSNRLAQLDVRAGADMGRIYRVYPKGARLRPVRDFTRLKNRDLAVAFNTTNGPARDLIHAQLLERNFSISRLTAETNSQTQASLKRRPAFTNLSTTRLTPSWFFTFCLSTPTLRNSSSITGRAE